LFHYREKGIMAELNGKNVLVIGASGALGAEFVRQLSGAGASVIGTSSSAETASKIPGEATGRFVLDLTNQHSISGFVAHLVDSGVTLDGLVLASGLVAFGPIAETPAEVLSRLMQVNFLGQAQAVKELQVLLEASPSDQPFVVSISGVIAESPMAGLAAYSASKTALLGYATAAARELRRAGIRWIDARPGHTETGLAGRAIFGTAPTFGAGLVPERVVERIVAAIMNDEKDLPSTAFTA
jgi:NAD(P)-dependent dehydrogenase (short-subunit alcohol dehydrogenase family)